MPSPCMRLYLHQMKHKHKIYSICLAGGSGTRMDASTPKVLLPINNIPALCHSLLRFEKSPFIDEILLVCPKGEVKKYEQAIHGYNITKLTKIVEGGKDRSHSVYSGLNAISTTDGYVLIHDGARPMVTERCIQLVIDKCKIHKNAIAASPVVNTLKKVKDTKILSTVNRDELWEVYTPQGFEYNLIKKAYDYVIKNNLSITDDASALEAIGEKAYVVDIGYRDFKLTTPDDIELVEKLLMKNQNLRMGLGFDVHRFADNCKLILGGIEIPYEKGLLGHSDADVLVHAIMDGILGAAGLPDIGQLFPDTSLEFKDIYSIKLLEKVMTKVINLGFVVNNIDAVVACELPKISPYRSQMIECISDALMCEENQINIKGTTTEKLGFEGRGEGISARCIVSLKTV